MSDTDARRVFATEVVQRLRSRGFQALWAGGCVRDLLMNHPPSDYDVATDARPQEVMGLFRRTFAVGASFGVVRVLGDDATGDVEVATFRSDGVYSDGRRPESVSFSTAEFDASRRDFTINGMFYDPIEACVIDYVGGRADLDRKVLRAIGDPFARFAEDKLRLLRAARFASRFDLAIDPTTRAAIVAMASEVTQVAPERIGQEWRKMLVHPSRVRSLEFVDESGLLTTILPSVARLKETDASAWDETKRVIAMLPQTPSFPLAMAALLRHVSLGPRVETTAAMRQKHGLNPLVVQVAEDLKLSNAERDLIAWLLRHDGELKTAESMRRSALKRVLASSDVCDLIALHDAVAQATDGNREHIDYCQRYLRDQPEGPIDPPPLVTGHDLMKHGLKPGPRFSDLLDSVRDAQLDGEIHSAAEALAFVDRLVANPRA